MCNDADDCTNVGDTQSFKLLPKPQVMLSKINTDTVANDDKLKIQGQFALADGQSFASLSPATTGARVIVLNLAGGVEVDVTLPGGNYGGRGTRGWKTNGAHTMWQYLDKTNDGTLAGTFNGISSLQIVNRSNKGPRDVQVKVQGKGGNYPVTTGDDPLKAIVVLGGHAASAAGLCGESAFVPADCAFNRSGNLLKCKK